MSYLFIEYAISVFWGKRSNLRNKAQRKSYLKIKQTKIWDEAVSCENSGNNKPYTKNYLSHSFQSMFNLLTWQHTSRHSVDLFMWRLSKREKRTSNCVLSYSSVKLQTEIKLCQSLSDWRMFSMKIDVWNIAKSYYHTKFKSGRRHTFYNLMIYFE